MFLSCFFPSFQSLPFCSGSSEFNFVSGSKDTLSSYLTTTDVIENTPLVGNSNAFSNRSSLLPPMNLQSSGRRDLEVSNGGGGGTIACSIDGVIGSQQQGGGSDDMVIVLRQMQGDLQAMTQCLQAHLNDISQCLVALHRTSLALQVSRLTVLGFS